MWITNYFLAGGWIVFWVYWIISAVGSKKNVSFDLRKFAGIRIGAFILVLAFIFLTKRDGARLAQTYMSQNSLALTIIGLVCFILGLVLAFWARLNLGKNWGMPMSVKRDPELVTSGPYRFIRHPIYSGILLAVLGSVLANGLYWLIILIAIGVYFIFAAREEENLMNRQFPKTYPPYVAKTKMLIPFIL